MAGRLQILTSLLFDEYKQNCTVDIHKAFLSVKKMPIEADTFTFYTSVSVISSSKIEGEKMEVDSYIKYKLYKAKYLPELVQKPNDLYSAYLFAQSHPLNTKNFLAAHALITAHLLPKSTRGKLRKNEMVVLDNTSHRIQYEACLKEQVGNEYKKLFSDIDLLIKRDLSHSEIFYYAAYVHLVFVNIHPFEDGNGRAARLLEKWFLSAKLGEMAWCISSEKHYYDHVNDYYKNLARQGLFYEQINYHKSLPFLLMLPQALKGSHK